MYDDPKVKKLPRNNVWNWDPPPIHEPRALAATIKIKPNSKEPTTLAKQGFAQSSFILLILLLILLSLLNRSGGFFFCCGSI